MLTKFCTLTVAIKHIIYGTSLFLKSRAFNPCITLWVIHQCKLLEKHFVVQKTPQIEDILKHFFLPASLQVAVITFFIYKQKFTVAILLWPSIYLWYKPFICSRNKYLSKLLEFLKKHVSYRLQVCEILFYATIADYSIPIGHWLILNTLPYKLRSRAFCR